MFWSITTEEVNEIKRSDPGKIPDLLSCKLIINNPTFDGISFLVHPPKKGENTADTVYITLPVHPVDAYRL